MSRTLVTLGALSAIFAIGMATGLVGGGGSMYTLRVVGNSSSGYAIDPNDKPLGDIYQVDRYRDIQWEFVNNTSPAEAIRIRMGDGEFLPNDCPVDWSNCEFLVPNLPAGNATPVDATADGEPDSYRFEIEIGRHPDGQLVEIDPELQIDDFFPFGPVLLALLSLLFFVGAWWTRRRTTVVR